MARPAKRAATGLVPRCGALIQRVAMVLTRREQFRDAADRAVLTVTVLSVANLSR